MSGSIPKSGKGPPLSHPPGTGPLPPVPGSRSPPVHTRRWRCPPSSRCVGTPFGACTAVGHQIEVHVFRPHPLLPPVLTGVSPAAASPTGERAVCAPFPASPASGSGPWWPNQLQKESFHLGPQLELPARSKASRNFSMDGADLLEQSRPDSSHHTSARAARTSLV